LEAIEKIVGCVLELVKDGGRCVYVMGNGGSAAEALHLSDELVGRYKDDRPPVRCVALPADPAVISCIGNDYGYAETFRRQVTAHVQEGDVVIGLSTSGNSENVLLALEKAKELGATTVGLTGGSGGKMGDVCDYVYAVPTEVGAHMQEEHLSFIHILCEAVDQHFRGSLQRSSG
jgi:D-sedoheptulose 7-phosphate isomerase